MRVFLDANVLFSAAKTNGAVRALVQRLLDAGHECWVDDYVVIEARRNLGAKGPEALAVFEALLLRLRVGPTQASTQTSPHVDWLPEKDRPVLAGAIGSRCDVLVTGDRSHFAAVYGKVFGGVTIHTPRSLAQYLFG